MYMYIYIHTYIMHTYAHTYLNVCDCAQRR